MLRDVDFSLSGVLVNIFYVYTVTLSSSHRDGAWLPFKNVSGVRELFPVYSGISCGHYLRKYSKKRQICSFASVVIV